VIDPGVESARHVLVRRIVTTIAILACIALLAVAVQHTRRGDAEEPTFTAGSSQENANIVELEAPAPESSVLSQAQITIDLNISYSATLTVAGVPIPDDQLQKRPELAQVSFAPGTGKAFEKLPQGRVCVDANVFRIDGVQEDPRTVTWCFNVT
jgi:hypothetical protein